MLTYDNPDVTPGTEFAWALHLANMAIREAKREFDRAFHLWRACFNADFTSG